MNRGLRFTIAAILLALAIISLVMNQKEPSVEETPVPAIEEPVPPIVPEQGVPAIETGQRMRAYLTGYTWWDNTPPGTPVIAFSKEWTRGTFHTEAGGVGTREDPITLAVGHVMNAAGSTTPDFEPGELFYVVNLQKYFVVEDVCGDGDRPQDGPCHRLDTPGHEAPPGAEVWLDMWVGGGVGENEALANNCMYAVTGVFLVIKNPMLDYKVNPGPIFQNGQCAQQFGDHVVLQM